MVSEARSRRKDQLVEKRKPSASIDSLSVLLRHVHWHLLNRIAPPYALALRLLEHLLAHLLLFSDLFTPHLLPPHLPLAPLILELFGQRN